MFYLNTEYTLVGKVDEAVLVVHLPEVHYHVKCRLYSKNMVLQMMASQLQALLEYYVPAFCQRGATEASISIP